MQLFCSRFYCDTRGDRFCCADCPIMNKCANPCLNHPSRCKLVDVGGAPVRRRGGKSKLQPIWNKAR